MIASFYWDRITNKAFTVSVLVALVFFAVARFELLPLTDVVAVVMEVAAVIGAAVVFGLMSFGLFGRTVGFSAAAISGVVLLPLIVGFLRDYPTLLGSLVAYGVSTAMCVAISLFNKKRFDFALINERVTVFQNKNEAAVERDEEPSLAAR